MSEPELVLVFARPHVERFGKGELPVMIVMIKFDRLPGRFSEGASHEDGRNCTGTLIGNLYCDCARRLHLRIRDEEVLAESEVR